MFARLLTLIIKELQLAFRDPRTRQMLILPVILQLMVFPFAATLEVKNSTLAILNHDEGSQSHELVERLAQARAFPKVLMTRSQAEITGIIDRQEALLGLEFPADFSRSLAAGRTATVVALVDGRRSNSAQIALGYAQSVVQGYGAELASAAGHPAPSEIVVRHQYNPNLDYRWFLMPALVAIITTFGSLVVTALSIAREREQGTFDQLLVSPLTPGQIMFGKAVPALLIAIGQGTIIALATVFIYHVPFHGSIALLYLGMICYGASLAGFGLFISALCETQQQAFLGVFSFLVPAIMLSGFISPVENMPMFFRVIAWIDPLSHFIVIVKGLFLKGYDFALIWPNLWPLILTTAFTVSIGYWMFRRRIA